MFILDFFFKMMIFRLVFNCFRWIVVDRFVGFVLMMIMLYFIVLCLIVDIVFFCLLVYSCWVIFFCIGLYYVDIGG